MFDLCPIFFCFQIRVNSVNPTVVNTDMGKVGWADPKKADPMMARIPLGRFAGKNEGNIKQACDFSGCFLIS